MTDQTSEYGPETWVGKPPSVRSCAPQPACLVFIYPTGTDMGRRYPLGTGPVVIGRCDTATIGVTDKSVSRTHARIDPLADGHVIADLGSRNGTYLNTVRIDTPRALEDGDYVGVGNCIFRYLAGGNIEAEYHEEIYRLTIMDGLTGVHNQRYLTDFLDRELARSVRHRRPLSVLAIDLDRFKRVNDTYGHQAGDQVLRELSRRVNLGIRREDLFARAGGEEFVAVLVETPGSQAVEVAERARRAVGDEPFHVDAASLNVTVSIGVATTHGDPPLTPADLLKAADANLYAAKRGGRNRVVASADCADATPTLP